jgi:hypothetical protein
MRVILAVSKPEQDLEGLPGSVRLLHFAAAHDSSEDLTLKRQILAAVA